MGAGSSGGLSWEMEQSGGLGEGRAYGKEIVVLIRLMRGFRNTGDNSNFEWYKEDCWVVGLGLRWGQGESKY